MDGASEGQARGLPCLQYLGPQFLDSTGGNGLFYCFAQ
jgi:predicted DNA-binding ribbon-helix-helix protein